MTNNVIIKKGFVLLLQTLFVVQFFLIFTMKGQQILRLSVYGETTH